MQKNMMNELDENIKRFYLNKEMLEKITKEQEQLKSDIISKMSELKINSRELFYSSDEVNKSINCNLITPVSIEYNLEAVRKDFPKYIEKETKLFLDTDESIVAFKLKLKEFGLSKSQFKELVNIMSVSKIEKVNQSEMQKEYDKGNIADISKYASIKEKNKYIKVMAKNV